MGRLPWNLRRLKIASVYPDFSSSLHVFSVYIVLWFTKVSPCLAGKKIPFELFLVASSSLPLPLSSPLPCPFHRDPVPASAPDMTAHPGGAHRGQRLLAGICVLWHTHKHTHTHTHTLILAYGQRGFDSVLSGGLTSAADKYPNRCTHSFEFVWLCRCGSKKAD